MAENEMLSGDDLRSVATYQKIILVCILLDILVYVAEFFAPDQLKLLLLLPHLAIVITATVFVFLLSTKVYSPVVGVLLGLLTLVPCLGLLALLVINGKATSILKKHGIRVGLLGANMGDFQSGPRPPGTRDEEDEKYGADDRR